VAITSDNKYFISASADRTIKIFASSIPTAAEKALQGKDDDRTNSIEYWRDRCFDLEDENAELIGKNTETLASMEQMKQKYEAELEEWSNKYNDVMKKLQLLEVEHSLALASIQTGSNVGIQTNTNSQLNTPLLKKPTGESVVTGTSAGHRFSFSGFAPQHDLTYIIPNIALEDDTNSLFHVIAYALEGPGYLASLNTDDDRKRIANSLRKLVSFYICKKPQDNLDLYGVSKSSEEYAKFIEEGNPPNGDVELNVFSEHYSIQFFKISILEEEIKQTIIPNEISQNQQVEKRVYILYDGRPNRNQRYDLIVGKNKKDEEVCFFDIGDKQAQEQCLLLAQNIRQNPK